MHIKNYNILYLTFLVVMILAISYFIMKYNWPRFLIPVCIIPMLTTLLFNQMELSLIMSLVNSVAIASMAGSHLYLTILFFSSGLLSALLVWNARRRMTIIRAGFIIGVLQAVFLFFIDRFWANPAPLYLKGYLNIMLSGIISGIVVIGILPLFEFLFKTVTNISLLELADFHHPLLEKMILEAPGTYHHSLVVGNLSETACQAVGANALLARIGAYYHDIGKLQKPGYFSENQDLKASKHDTLAPSMSKLIIMHHVKEGVELAKKYKLNPPLIDFIAQHHGDSLVYYFYRRALENLEDDEGIKEEGFRYPGPKPNSKETAIVLLADSVEAATRALKDPAAPVKIEETVHKVINNKFIDGQLDECDLTLKDLEKISDVFIRILSGIYHSRVTYPEQPRSENNNKKLPKEDSRLSEKDKRDNP
jgi:putative nucleotidyltransferase with HDIG domain